MSLQGKRTPALLKEIFKCLPDPVNAVYYNGFEGGTFPDEPEWTTTGEAPWELTTERVAGGVYSIRSPDLSNDEITSLTSNVTLDVGPEWEGGILTFSVLAGVKMPIDNCSYYVDGVVRGNLADMTEFRTREIRLSPGPHAITWSFNRDMFFFLPTRDYVGAVFLDDVHLNPVIGRSGI